MFSRSGRVYSNLHPSCFEQLRITARVIGPLAQRDTPSDHRAVRVVFRAKGWRTRLVVWPEVAQHPLFQVATTSPEAHLTMVALAAHSARRRTPHTRRNAHPLTEAAKADICLQVVRRVRAGRADQAADMFREVPVLAGMVSGEVVAALLRMLASFLQAVALQDIRAVERSSAPELYKSAQK